MCNTCILTACFLLTLIPGSVESTAQKSNYTVSEVLRVVSPVTFQCKLTDYTPSQTVRFTVQIRNINGPDSSSNAILKNKLLSSGKIELRNVRFRNYFRIEADLWVDEEDVVPYLLNNGWTQLPMEQRPVEPVTRSKSRRMVLAQDTSVSGRAADSPVRVIVSRPTIRTLLNTQVDCSSLSSETTFAEALDILTHSVNPPLPLLVMWSDLETNAFVEKDMLIGTDGFRTMRLEQALDIVLRSVSVRGGVKPVLVTEGGIATIGTQQTLLKRLKPKVYSIEDLLAAPSVASEYNDQGSRTSR